MPRYSKNCVSAPTVRLTLHDLMHAVPDDEDRRGVHDESDGDFIRRRESDGIQNPVQQLVRVRGETFRLGRFARETL